MKHLALPVSDQERSMGAALFHSRLALVTRQAFSGA
jgi:hypothetical protein